MRYDWKQVGSTRRGHRFLRLSNGLHVGISECGNARPPLAHMPMTRDTVMCATCRRLQQRDEKRVTP